MYIVFHVAQTVDYNFSIEHCIQKLMGHFQTLFLSQNDRFMYGNHLFYQNMMIFSTHSGWNSCNIASFSWVIDVRGINLKLISFFPYLKFNSVFTYSRPPNKIFSTHPLTFVILQTYGLRIAIDFHQLTLYR